MIDSLSVEVIDRRAQKRLKLEKSKLIGKGTLRISKDGLVSMRLRKIKTYGKQWSS